MKTRLVLGDIHGHFEHVRELYDKYKPQEVICLGDYVDSFVKTPEQHKECLEKLFELKKTHEEEHGSGTFIMVLGNHDFHYLVSGEKYSGWNPQTSKLCRGLLQSAIDKNIIKMVHIDWKNKTIYSHAGVTNTWMTEWNVGHLGEINDLAFDAFKFTYGDRWSSSGDSKYNGPLWVRPFSLVDDIYKDAEGVVWRQVVGHTHTKKVIDFMTMEGISDARRVPVIVNDNLPFGFVVEALDDDGTLIEYGVVQRDFEENYTQ